MGWYVDGWYITHELPYIQVEGYIREGWAQRGYVIYNCDSCSAAVYEAPEPAFPNHKPLTMRMLQEHAEAIA